MTVPTAPTGIATQIACALAEEFFGFPDPDGRTAVPLDAAALVAAGRLDLWRGWAKQTAATRRLVGRFLRVRPNEIGAHRRFTEMARALRADTDSPYGVPEDVPDDEVVAVVARHGQRPLDLVRRLLDEAEVKYVQGRRPLPVAGPGRWSFGWRGQSVVDLSPAVKGGVVDPIVLDTTPPVAEVTVKPEELRRLADEIATRRGERPWQARVLHELFAGLRTDNDVPVHELLLRPGGIRLLNAPTGVGKSVLIRLLALHLARSGVPVAIVVGTVHEAMETADKISSDLQTLDLPRRCTALVSPRRLAEKAAQAADRGQWARFDTLAYGCALSALVVDGPQPVAPDEPCTGLRPMVEQPGVEEKRQPAPRHACPYLGVCGRHQGLRDAAAADIIVTNHHNLVHGTVPVPVRVDGVELNRLPVQEFLLRRCAVLLADEVDLLQSNMFDAGARQLKLAASGTVAELPLVRLDTERTMLLPAEDRAVVPPLTRTRFLADQFLNYVLEGDLWLGDARPAAHGPRKSSSGSADSGWHLPGSRDRMLLKHLFELDDSTENAQDVAVPAEVYQQFNALFPDIGGTGGADLPEWLREVADLLASAVSNDSGQDHIREVRHRLHEVLEPHVAEAKDRRDVVNALLVRTWLGALHQALTRLTFAVAAPGTEMPAARVLAEQLGTVAQHQAIPYGPLGYLLFGFRVDRVEDPRLGGTLSVQAVGGDPHTTVAQLGGTVALAAAGVERVVLGLSATAYFPGAGREHIRACVTYAMTDAKPGTFSTRAGEALDEQYQTIHIGGRAEAGKDAAIRALGASLWDQHIDAHLRTLAATEPDRELCMLVGNSYRHAVLLAAGIASRTADPGWVAVVVPRHGSPSPVVLPAEVVTVTIDELESLPHKHPGVKVCIAPLSLVARGLNILVPGDQRSALASVWVCVRPPAQVTDSAEMFASVNAYALGKNEPSVDPVAVWVEQRKRAFFRLFHILTSDPRFSRLSRALKAEAVAGMLVEMIQLAGRARRGGTPVQLFLADGAFHDPKHGTDIPGLLRYYYANLSPVEQRELRRIYGSTLVSWLDFAGIGDEEDR
ncbi:hypothetical protein KIPE111705_30850 [Kibdelosporangium persicum]|uniref:Helicase ATP-binding domain-containing protein n=1 Tax=Kibdelosporangium persicum TaxID=2698649 RepID=A0ABX2FFL8_9PSEU|nr:hypothetical protein [Kibdelosporangium persicum]NRN70181.1 Helicase ATP-binding domain-containing protein [Kibdelosporangium persicum]